MYCSELLSLPNFRILPRTLTHLSTYVHLYCRVYLYYISYVHCIYTPRVLHFSAFIISVIQCIKYINIYMYMLYESYLVVLTTSYYFVGNVIASTGIHLFTSDVCTMYVVRGTYVGSGCSVSIACVVSMNTSMNTIHY